jgi:hypothetical protein
MSGIFLCLVLLKHIIDFFKPNVIKEGIGTGSAPQTKLNASLPAIKLSKIKPPKLNGDLTQYTNQDIKLGDRFKLKQDNPQNNPQNNPQYNPLEKSFESQINETDKSSKNINKRLDRETESTKDTLSEIIIKIFNKGEIEITK